MFFIQCREAGGYWSCTGDLFELAIEALIFRDERMHKRNGETEEKIAYRVVNEHGDIIEYEQPLDEKITLLNERMEILIRRREELEKRLSRLESHCQSLQDTINSELPCDSVHDG